MATLTIHFDRSGGKIRPLHGVNNGPISHGSMVDVSHYYRELAIPYARLHDPNWPHPREVDIPQIFPNFEADVNDPASYRFSQTDMYLKKILETGAKIVYRLGTSIEGAEIKYFTHPPKDPHKWAQICLHVIRHYNDGWAGGFHHGIEYWEVWNEPDLGPNMWSGTPEQYFELYAATAPLVKKHFPQVKIGGFAASRLTGPMLRNFLIFCKDKGLPFDFLTWHGYEALPQLFVKNARFARALLDEHGFKNAESHLNEWNYRDFEWDLLFKNGNEHYRRAAFEHQANEIGASFVAAMLIALQDEPIDLANYYDGQPAALFCGIFDTFGVPTKAYYGMKAFREMLDYPERVVVEGAENDKGLYGLAAINREKTEAAILISNLDGTPGIYSVGWRGLPVKKATAVEVFSLDQYRNLEPVPFNSIDAGNKGIALPLNRYAVALIKRRLVP